MTIKIISESEAIERLKMADAVKAVEGVLTKVAKEQYICPPRHHVKNDNGSIAFTVGGDTSEGVIGFRVYDTFPTDIQHEQFVTVFDASTGALKGIVLGEHVGATRTGALGGAAIRALSRPTSRSLAIVGTGLQARTQLRAALAVRDIESIKVYGRTLANAEGFVEEMMPILKGKNSKGEMHLANSAEEAVRDTDIVILATKSATPIIDASWLKDGCHLNSVGPKFKERHELPVAIADRADKLVTDSLKQLSSYPKEHFLAEHPSFGSIKDLSRFVSDPNLLKRKDQDVTVFLSVGLSGTEPAIADLLL